MSILILRLWSFSHGPPTLLDSSPSNPELAKTNRCSLACCESLGSRSFGNSTTKRRKERKKNREPSGIDFPCEAKALHPTQHACLRFNCCDVGMVVSPSVTQMTGLELALGLIKSGVQTRTVHQLSDVNKIRNTLGPGGELFVFHQKCLANPQNLIYFYCSLITVRKRNVLLK